MALRQTPLTCNGHTRPVVDLAFSDITADGYFLISACKDGKPMLRQGDTGDWIGTFEGHKGAVWGATLNPEATKAATGAADFSAKIWDAVSGEELISFSHKHIVKSVNFSKDTNKLLTGSNEKILRLYDLNNVDSEPFTLLGHQGAIRSAKFFDNNTKVISASDDKTIRIWDVDTLEEIKKFEFSTAPSSIEISSDGSLFIVTYSDIVSSWNTQTFEKEKELQTQTLLNSASMHHENKVFVCAGEDFKMYKYDYVTGEELESFKGHFGPIHTVCFSPDGELYASGSEDGTLRLWQTTIGKKYGLWSVSYPEENSIETTQEAVKSEP